jgi:hypothetical protein
MDSQRSGLVGEQKAQVMAGPQVSKALCGVSHNLVEWSASSSLQRHGSDQRDLFQSLVGLLIQPGILNRYHGLVGQRADEPDDVLVKWLGLPAPEDDAADQRV